MSTPQINAAKEILSGMYDGLNRMYESGREPSRSLLEDIAKREDEIEDMQRRHDASDMGGRSCRCGAHHHGGDCMCFED